MSVDTDIHSNHLKRKSGNGVFMGAATLGEPLHGGGGGGEVRDGGCDSMVERPDSQVSNRNSHPFTERQAKQQMDGEWDCSPVLIHFPFLIKFLYASNLT